MEPVIVRVYLTAQDEDIYKTLLAIKAKTRMSVSMIGLLVLRKSLPDMERILSDFASLEAPMKGVDKVAKPKRSKQKPAR